MYDLFTSKFTLFKTNVRLQSFTGIKFGIFQFRRFLMLNYNVLSYNQVSVESGANNLRSRLRSKSQISTTFLGFKFKCVGRFTRRQRAISYVVMCGKVPLNSVDACIDYDSFCVVLDIVLLLLKFDFINYIIIRISFLYNLYKLL